MRDIFIIIFNSIKQMIIMQQTLQDQPATQEAEWINCPAVREIKESYLCLFPHALLFHWRVFFKEGLAGGVGVFAHPVGLSFDLFTLVLHNIVQNITCTSFWSSLADG